MKKIVCGNRRGDDPVPNEVREYTSAKPNLIKFLMGLNEENI
jgi:hypothetical protein